MFQQKCGNVELAKCCENMFEQLEISENSKKRAHAWPLQIILLVLCPVSIIRYYGF